MNIMVLKRLIERYRRKIVPIAVAVAVTVATIIISSVALKKSHPTSVVETTESPTSAVVETTTRRQPKVETTTKKMEPTTKVVLETTTAVPETTTMPVPTTYPNPESSTNNSTIVNVYNTIVMPTTSPATPTVPATTIPATTVPATTVPATTVPATTVPATTVPATTVPTTMSVPETTTAVPETTTAVSEEPCTIEEPTTRDVKKAKAPSASSTSGTCLGTYTLTAYCPCYQCSEGWGRQTSSGATATSNHTVACNSLPAGSRIYIEGYGTYVVHDTGGGLGSKTIDIFFDTHGETTQFGRRSATVYLLD